MAKPFQQQTYYELLEVSPKASMDEIRSAYERASELYAPDSVAIYALENPAMAEELRALLREAMEILTDPDLRQEYDRELGLAPRIAPAEVLRSSEEEEEQAPAAMAEVIAPATAVDSTHRELRVSYVGAQGSATTPSARQPNDNAPASAAPAEAEPRALQRAPSRVEAPMMSAESAIGEAEAEMAKVAARVKETAPRPKALEIPPDAEFSGELLRRVREAKGLGLQQIADRTRISSRHLENIEADRYKDLPATVYLRGMLTVLARELGLDGVRVAKSYLGLAAKKPGGA